MSLLGIHLTILAGASVPLPLPERALSALDQVEITQGTESQSMMQAQFRAGRGSTIAELADYPILRQPGLQVGARIVVTVTLGVRPRVLFDGFVTDAQLNPGQGSGDGTLAITCEDLGFQMSREERSEDYPGMPVAAIAAQVMGRYAQYGLVPVIVPPATSEVTLPIERVATQAGTDIDFLRTLAASVDYIFAIKPGPVPTASQGYFGPQPRLGVPQRALTVNMGPDTNVASIDFQYAASEAHSVEGEVQDRTSNRSVPVRSVGAQRAPLATSPAATNRSIAGTRLFRAQGAESASAAMSAAQAEADRSTDVLTAEGELDGAKYSAVLEPRGLVGLRGAGHAHDGFWYVQEVTHRLSRGAYKQQFRLTREGTGTTTPVVMP